jgi:hypothetical protein
MSQERILVKVDRQTVNAKDVDLPFFIQSVYEQILRNYQLFGAEERYDIYPEEITLSHVIVYNNNDRTYTRAIIEIGEGEAISFKKVEKVKREWVPVDSVERSEDNSGPYVYPVFKQDGLWGTVL